MVDLVSVLISNLKVFTNSPIDEAVTDHVRFTNVGDTTRAENVEIVGTLSKGGMSGNEVALVVVEFSVGTLYRATYSAVIRNAMWI